MNTCNLKKENNYLLFMNYCYGTIFREMPVNYIGTWHPGMYTNIHERINNKAAILAGTYGDVKDDIY